MGLDLKYAFRMLRKYPAVTGIAMVALALGIGLNATMFSIVYGALFRGLPFDGAERLMHIERVQPESGTGSIEVPIHDYVDWKEQQTSFDGLAAFYTGTVNVRGTERAVRFDGAFITPNGLRLVGVQPELGRHFRDEEGEPGADLTVIIGHGVWRDRFDSDPDVVGTIVTVNGEQATLVGVMPEGFRFPFNQDVWVPLRMNPLEIPRGEGMTLEVFGRLAEGNTLDQAQAEMAGIAGRLASAYPATNEGVGVLIKPYTEEFIGDEVSSVLWAMMVAVFLVLLVACANVANLLLARASLRTREIAVRTALGAGRWRVVSQLLTESVVLSLIGALVGAGLAWFGISWFAAAVEGTDPPFWLEFKLDAPILLFVLGTSVVAGVVSGLLPAFQATGSRINEVLKDESRGSSGMRVGVFSKFLILAQVAFSVAALAGAGLMIKNVGYLSSIDYGFEHAGVFTGRIGIFEAAYPTEEARRGFFDEVIQEASALPGVEAVALSQGLPALGSGGTYFQLSGQSYETPRDVPIARFNAIDGDFFDVFGVGPVQGRLFTEQDDADALLVALVTETFARMHLEGREAVGAQLRIGGLESERAYRTVVGVVPDMWMQGVQNDTDPPTGIYVPRRQWDARFLTLSARTRGAPLELAPQVRDLLASIDPDVPLYNVNTLEGTIRDNTWFVWVFGTLFAAFGAAALFLAAVGLYGVMSFGVSRRTQEVGIRMALGAEGNSILRLMLRQGMVQFGVGLVLGLGLSFAVTQPLRTVMVSETDSLLMPDVYGIIVGVLCVTGIMASLIPARRATRVDPVEALRYE